MTKYITINEFEVRDELREKRENITTFDDLTAFIKDVEENHNYDYGVAPRAIAQASVAVAYYLAGKFGITGFQAKTVMWDFIRDWAYRNNDCGLKLVNFDHMLYPQYADEFDKTISTATWSSLQAIAEARLDNKEYAHQDIITHWESIAAGNVPFGYIVKDN